MVGEERGWLVQASVPRIVEVVAVVVRRAVVVAVERRVAVHEPRACVAAKRWVVARLRHGADDTATIAAIAQEAVAAVIAIIARIALTASHGAMAGVWTSLVAAAGRAAINRGPVGSAEGQNRE